MNTSAPEIIWLWAGMACYLASAVTSVRGAASVRAESGRSTLAWLVAALFFVAAAIAVRWSRIAHGPFLSMFEILLSNLFSLGTIYALAYWLLPRLRRSALVVTPILLLLALWATALKPVDTHLPPSYAMPILWLHVAAGKLFLGLSLVAVGLSGAILLRRVSWLARWFATMPDDSVIDVWVWRFMSVAIVFESLMLIAGAMWAQDAWGRYWAWDPLETWAFVTWVAAAAAIHARLAYRVSERNGALMVMTVFALAFLTFFGVPFLSVAPHKGAV
jgi:ABC-type transport system involved in cytochrome c biogenesis permease subunit